MRRRKEKTWGQIIRGWMLFILVLLALLLGALQFAGQKITAADQSMVPAVYSGDEIWVSRLWYRIAQPHRGDVVIIADRNQDDVYYVKRIIALPGETVQIQDGAVYLNGVRQDDLYSDQTILQPGLASIAITLGEDSYFVLGDNRNDSIDSREPTIGNVKSSEIVGKALFIGSPLRHMGLIH